MASPGGDDSIDDSGLFEGVRFVLLGFDPAAEAQYRPDIVQRGGIDAGRLGNECTHVVVWGCVYDDPDCVAARVQGKKVVTELWVDDSLDRGELVDADRVIYWPLRDFSGIPGAESMIICLTGYQRKYREDITKMVSFMGAQFSKPLAANEVTHLICYKFEGDKYELAKRVNIKLVNHRWLENCLKAWEILPVDDYSRSSWELELMEAQAKDSEDEADDAGQRSFKSRSSGRRTPNSSIPTIPNGNMDQVSGKHSVSRDQINVKDLDSSKVDKVHQEKDAPSGNLIAAVGRSTADDELTYDGKNRNSGGDSMYNNIDNRSKSNSKKASQKSLPPEGHSGHCMASDQKAENSTLRAHSNNSSLETGQQRGVEHAGIQRMKSNGNFKIADGLDVASSKKRKSLNSSSSIKLSKKDLVPESNPLDCPFVSRLSDASEPANVSSASPNPAEASAVDLGKQQSSLSTSRQSRSKKHSLKHCGHAYGVKIPEKSSGKKNANSLQKARTPHMAVRENNCSVSPSATVQDGKESSVFSFLNKDGPGAQASGNAENRDFLHLMHETGNACTKDHDASVSSSRSSHIVSCSGIATSITDALRGNDNEVAVASNFKLEKMLSDANVKEGTKQFQGTSSNVQGVTSYSKKVVHSVERNAGAKRPRSASMEADESVINCVKKLVPESRPAQVLPHEHADPASKNGSTANAEELETVSPKKVPDCRVRNTVAKRTRNAYTKMNDAQVTSSLESSKVISQDNTEICPQKFIDSANADNHQRNSPKKLPNTRVRYTAAKKSKKSDTLVSNGTSVDKTETVASGLLFDDLFPSVNVEECPKMLSSTASASNCGTLLPKNISNPRVRNAVAEKKITSVEDTISSKCGKIGSAIVSVANAVSSKRTAEMSCNINQVTGDQYSEKANEDGLRDVAGLFCQGSTTVDKPEGLNNSKLMRSSKRNKALTSDDEKENRQDRSNLNSKSNATTGSLCSKSDGISIQKGTDVLSGCQGIKGNESGTFITSEPASFILSGNRQQRREYRSILRRLKGRVCRDSHHWSYQATHFIAPGPLRRIEKFFAAAAAGRWILKSDYLTSCIEAGKFLHEESFEWFGTGLSDGEKISLEAPRKWRTLRQQVRHGAFYGMQIIVYGQLILPTLDTLKRAVRAGDGTILATSPPYTRFLNSGVDFAVVSLGMPSADAWVQEFIRHGIPCVSADYLVEYVCKPGHPLDSHVLFKTNDLANTSLQKLTKNQQEVAADEPEPSEDDELDDISCSACGRKDRGHVMLICGDEDGTTGCGIGMHIDCCNPPLDAVPDEDWFCPKCDIPKAKMKPKGSPKKPKTKPKRSPKTAKTEPNGSPDAKTKPKGSTGRKLRPAKEM